MELLNNIWNALTTPNECLISILSIPFTVIEIVFSVLLFSSLLNIKSSKKQKLIYIAFISFVSIISNYFIPTPFNLIINYIFMV